MSEYNSRPDGAPAGSEAGDILSSQPAQPSGTTGPGDYADEARERAAGYGEKARQQAEVGRQQAATGMEKAAGMMRERVSHANGGMATQAGTKVADGMEKTASYLKGHDTQEIFNDVETYAKKHPTQALAGAVVAGFLLGRLIG